MASIWHYVLGGIFFLSAIFAFMISISAKKIDFGDRLFKLRKRDSGLRADVAETIYKRKTKGTLPSIEELPSSKSDFSSKLNEVEEVKHDDEIDALSGADIAPPKKKKTKERSLFDDEILEKEEEKVRDEEAKIEETSDSEIIKAPSAPPNSAIPSPSQPLPPPPPSEEEIKEFQERASKVIEEQEYFSRDLALQLPKNMCLDEVFRLKVVISKTEDYTAQTTIKELELSKKDAEYFSINITKLGEKVVEATTRINGLKKGSLVIRPIAIGNVAAIAPAQRTIFFDQTEKEYVVEFFITPTKYSKNVTNILRIEFDQNYKTVKTVNVPMKIYKYKFEAIFGLNISKWQQNALFVYSALGTIAGIISSLQDKIVPFLQGLF